jgi:hypothetical protein
MRDILKTGSDSPVMPMMEALESRRMLSAMPFAIHHGTLLKSAPIVHSVSVSHQPPPHVTVNVTIVKAKTPKSTKPVKPVAHKAPVKKKCPKPRHRHSVALSTVAIYTGDDYLFDDTTDTGDTGTDPGATSPPTPTTNPTTNPTTQPAGSDQGGDGSSGGGDVGDTSGGADTSMTDE